MRAIIAVHLYGQPADMANINKFAKANNLFVIEDVAQAFGAKINTQMLGTLGDVGCFSFYPGKNLGAAGEAGLVITNSKNLAQKIRSLRNHGQSERYTHDKIGYNYRMDGLQAAVLSAKLAYVKSWNDERSEIAHQYSNQLAELPITLPQKIAQDHVWHLFVVRSNERDRLKLHLETRGVSTGLHYPIPLHQQGFLQGFLTEPPVLPITEDWAKQCLSLPIFPGMTKRQIKKVVQAVGIFMTDLAQQNLIAKPKALFIRHKSPRKASRRQGHDPDEFTKFLSCFLIRQSKTKILISQRSVMRSIQN